MLLAAVHADEMAASRRGKKHPLTRTLSRFARASLPELVFRAAEKSFVLGERAAHLLGSPSWQRSDLAERILELPETREACAALRQQRWADAGEALRTHFNTRRQMFLVHPTRRIALVSSINAAFPHAREEAEVRAGSLLDGRYDLLGYQNLSFSRAGDLLDWHFDPVHGRRSPLDFWAGVPYLDPRCGDHKIIWELNRHQHWLKLGRAAWLADDPRFAARAVEELESWLAANPPLTGINWASMLELALRSLSWIWALHLFAPLHIADASWILDLLLGLDRQLEHIRRHLSRYFSPNTHLIGEGLALYVGGSVLPELTGAEMWKTIGRQVLMRESRAQVHPDGGHAELSPHYHRYALDFYLLALAVARETGDPVERELSAVVTPLAEFCRTLASDDGRLPTIGDDDGGQLFPICGRRPDDVTSSLAIAAALLHRPDLAVGDPPEETYWFCGEPGPPVTATEWRPRSTVFRDTGYAVLRSAESQAILDVGRHGFLNGGHAHADALSIVLRVKDLPLLVDPGTATYTMDAEVRDRFRSTAMHNTVTVDGRSQSVPAGPFHWHSRADASLASWCPGPGFDFVEASHGAYAPIQHRRVVGRTPDDLWLIADRVQGDGTHQVQTYWHIDPSWRRDPTAQSPALHLVHENGTRAAIASTAEHRESFFGDPAGYGWVAPVYGEVVPALTVRHTQSGAAPLSVLTVVTGSHSPIHLRVTWLVRDEAPEDGCARDVAVVNTDDAALLVLLAWPDEREREHDSGERALYRVPFGRAEFATDARFCVFRVSKSGAPLSVLAVHGRRMVWTGPGAFDLQPSSAAESLHMDQTSLLAPCRAPFKQAG